MASWYSRWSTAAKLVPERPDRRIASTSRKAEAPVQQTLTAELLIEVAQLWLATGWVVVLAVAATFAAAAWVFARAGDACRRATDPRRWRHLSRRTPNTHDELTSQTDDKRRCDEDCSEGRLQAVAVAADTLKGQATVRHSATSPT